MKKTRNTKLSDLSVSEKAERRKQQKLENQRKNRALKNAPMTDLATTIEKATNMTMGELREKLIKIYGKDFKPTMPKPLEGKALADLEYIIETENLAYKPKKSAFESRQPGRKVIFPWQHTNASDLSKLTWIYADEFYQTHKQHPEYGYIKIKCIIDLKHKVDLSAVAAESIFIALTVKNWIPTEDADWVNFKREFDEEKKKS